MLGVLFACAGVVAGATALIKPRISGTIDLADTSEFKFNRTLITYGTYDFRLTFQHDDTAIDISNAVVELSAKTYDDAIADPSGTDFLFQSTGSIVTGPSGIASFPIEEGYLDTNCVGKVRLEFRLYNETDNSDIRTFADLYVQPAVSAGTEVAWTPPDPATNYYTRAEVDALIQYFGAENANNTWQAGTTNIFTGVLRSEFLYPTDNLGSYLKLYDDSGTSKVELYSEQIKIWSDLGLIYLDGHVYVEDGYDLILGSGTEVGRWSADGLLWTKGTDSALNVSERTDANDYVSTYVASDVYTMTSTDVTQVRYFGDSSNPVNTVDWFTSDPGTGDDPIMRIYMIAGGAGNALQFGRATAIDFVTITSLGEPILFGDTASPSMGLVDDPGEVGFLEDVEVDGSIRLDGTIKLNGVVSDDLAAYIEFQDSMLLTNSSSYVKIQATTGTYPELSLFSGTTEVMEVKAASQLFTFTDNVGQKIEFQTDSEEEIVITGGETGAGVYRIGDDGTAPHHFDTGDVQVDEDLTVNGSATVIGTLVTVGASTDMKLQGYGMLINALETSGNPYFIDSGTNASDGDGIVTETFTITFGAAPIVVASYAENAVVSAPLIVYSITTTNCVFAGDADVSFNWIAIGSKP